jgi:ferredoxin
MSDAGTPGRDPAEAVERRVAVTFVTNDMKTVSAPENSNLLRVSLREQGGIPFKCGGGLCGTCRCRIESGLEHTDAVKPKERRHLTEADLANGFRMACQTFINGDISVSWEPREAAGQAAKSPSSETTART